MTRTRELVAGVAVMLLIAGSSWGVIAGSNHDFTGGGTGAAASTSTDICSPCHVPHKPLQNVPLWAHTLTVATYDLYEQNPEYSSGNNAAYETSPYDFAGSLSRACLSCHDGTVAASGAVTLTDADAWILWNDGAADVGGVASTGLMGSHPVGVNYDTIATAHPTEYNDPPTGSVVLEGDTHVQCTSCHNAHNVVAKMLVESNASSALCLRCHIK